MDSDLTILCLAGVVGEACSGWGFLIIEPDGMIEEGSGACADGSTDRMVIRSAVEALSRCGSGQEILARTRSRTLVRTATDWIPGWREDGWQSADGVADLRLIQELADTLERVSVRWVHIPYAENPADRRARQLAQEATTQPVEDLDPWAEPEPLDEEYVDAQHPEEVPAEPEEPAEPEVPAPSGLEEPEVLESPEPEVLEPEIPPEPAPEPAEAAPAEPLLEEEPPAEPAILEPEEPEESPPAVEVTPRLSAPLPAPDPTYLPGLDDPFILPATAPLPAPRLRPPRGFHLLREAPLVPSTSIIEPTIPAEELPDIGATNAIAEAMALVVGPRLVVYVDGRLSSEEQTRGPGGWGFLLIDRKTNRALARRGGTAWTTVHRLELTAAMEALKSLRGGQQEVEIRTDFRWLAKAGESWLSTWRRQNWTRRNGQQVSNVDLLRQIDAACQQHRVSWRWVPEHCDEAGNHFTADLSQRALEEMQIGNSPDKTTRYAESPISDLL